jgi:hypothetical protein
LVATAACPAPDSRSWTELYRNAILEVDRNKLPELIDAAEEALMARARELFDDTRDHIEEQHALDDALYALKALRDSLTSGRMRPN